MLNKRAYSDVDDVIAGTMAQMIVDAGHKATRALPHNNFGELVLLVQRAHQKRNDIPPITNDPRHMCAAGRPPCIVSRVYCTVEHRASARAIMTSAASSLWRRADDAARQMDVSDEDYDVRFISAAAFRARDRESDNVLYIDNLYACPTFGKLHACGKNCVLARRETKGGEYICPVTGLVMGQVLSEDVWGPRQDEPPQPSLWRIDAVTGVAKIDGALLHTAASDAQRIEAVRHVLRVLLMSDERQNLELNRIIAFEVARSKAQAAATRRVSDEDRGDKMLFFAWRAQEVTRARPPDTAYFNRFRVSPSVMQSVYRSINAVASVIGVLPRTPAGGADAAWRSRLYCNARQPQACEHCRVRDLHRRYQELIDDGVCLGAPRPGIAAPPGAWDQTDELVARGIDVMCRVVVRIYANLSLLDSTSAASRAARRTNGASVVHKKRKQMAPPRAPYSAVVAPPLLEPDWPEGPEGPDSKKRQLLLAYTEEWRDEEQARGRSHPPPPQLPKFKNMIIPLLYMMRTGLQMPTRLLSSTSQAGDYTTVIPKIQLATYLPSEADIGTMLPDAEYGYKNMVMARVAEEFKSYFAMARDVVQMSKMEIKLADFVYTFPCTTCILFFSLHYFRALFPDRMASIDMGQCSVIRKLPWSSIFGGKENSHCLRKIKSGPENYHISNNAPLFQNIPEWRIIVPAVYTAVSLTCRRTAAFFLP
jgi:hypothetical protein